jgi:hypothetical protein
MATVESTGGGAASRSRWGMGPGMLSALAVLAGCGDDQVGRAYLGEPRWQYQGSLQATAEGVQDATDLRLAVFFSPQGLNVVDPAQYVEQLSASQAVTIPSHYVLSVFESPPPAVLLRNTDGSSAGYAMGRIFVYRDLDASGAYSPGEPFLGNEGATASLYVPEPLPEGSTPTVGALPAGLLRVRLPQPCGLPPPPATDPDTCGVPLGSLCTRDSDCNGGVCRLMMPSPWHEGVCAINDPPPSGCRPANAAYWAITPMSIEYRQGLRGRYLRRCQTDSDCRRPDEQHKHRYTCDPGLLGCVPALSDFAQLSVGSMVPIGEFCGR